MRTVRVLVVDDNEDHRFLIERALRRVAGVHVEISSAEDGEQALAHLHVRSAATGGTPHMVLLDLRMPRLGGLEVLEKVRSHPQLRRIPICVLTSSDRPEDVEEAYERGTSAYVVKSQELHGIHDVLAGVAEFWGGLVALPEPP